MPSVSYYKPPSPSPRPAPVTVAGSAPLQSRGRTQPTAIVLKMATDTKRQHAAIGKLVKMARSSAVVTNASRGITAEVRRDRERGHE